MFAHNFTKKVSLEGAFLLLVLTVLCLTVLPSYGATSNWDVDADVDRLRQEAPSLLAFPDATGVLWLRDIQYDLQADGSMTKNRRFILLVGEDLTSSWSNKRFSMPVEGGNHQILVAAWYEPNTGKRGGSLEVVETIENGLSLFEIKLLPVAAGKIAAIEIREDFPKRYFLDDAIAMALDLPVWDQKITVKRPFGMPLHWEGVGIQEPETIEQQGQEVTTWRVTNQPIWEEGGLITQKQPILVFSLKEGIVGALRRAQELSEALKSIPLPNSIKNAETLASWVSDSKRLLVGYPENVVRSVSALPKMGRWTQWERTFMAHHWFKQLGWGSKLFWRMITPVNEGYPEALGLLESPILELTPPKGDSFFFFPGQIAEFGKMPHSLYGAELYSLSEGNTLFSRALPQGVATEHKLTQNWNLTLAESGIAEGYLDLLVLGNWVRMLDLDATDSSALVRKINSVMDFRLPNLVLSSPDIRSIRTGYSVRFKVRAPLGIVSGNDLLLRIPGALPKQLETFSSIKDGAHLAFPFLLEQRIQIATPKGFHALPIYPLNPTLYPQVSLQGEMIHWPKKGQLEGQVRWIVRTSGKIDEQNLRGMLNALSDYLSWVNSTVALRK